MAAKHRSNTECGWWEAHLCMCLQLCVLRLTQGYFQDAVKKIQKSALAELYENELYEILDMKSNVQCK